MSRAHAIGRWGESLAASYLAEKGYVVLARNVRTGYGELDLVVRDDEILVFVEVKTRTSTAFGQPEDAVTPKKQTHLLAAAQAYLQEHPEWVGDWRIDVVAITHLRGASQPQIVHFESAVS